MFHTFNSLLEVLDRDFQTYCSMANRALGKIIAEYGATLLWSSSGRGVVDPSYIVKNLWGGPNQEELESLVALMHRLSRPNGFDFTDVATYLLEKNIHSQRKYVSYYPATQELVIN